MKWLYFILFIWGTVNAQSLKVGVVLPLSGTLSSYGNDCLYGMKLAAEESGVCSLIIEDNSGDKLKTKESIKKLTSQGVAVIAGPMVSENAFAAAYYVDSLNIPLILPAATHPLLTKVSNLVFRVCYTDEFQALVMAEFVYFSLHKKRVGLLVEITSPYSVEVADAFTKEIERLGGLIVATKIYERNETNFSLALSKIAETKPDCIFIPGYYQEVGLIIKQTRALQIDVPLVGCDGWDSQTLVDLAGEGSGVNFYCSHFFSKDPEVQGFRDKYVNKFAAEPSSFSALGYDAIKLISSLKLENTEPETIIEELSKVNNFNGVTGTIDFSERRDPIRSVVIIKMEKGKLSIQQKVIPQKEKPTK